jgi:hypothetical protein
MFRGLAKETMDCKDHTSQKDMVFSDNTFNYGDCNFIDNACSPFHAIKKVRLEGIKARKIK